MKGPKRSLNLLWLSLEIYDTVCCCRCCCCFFAFHHLIRNQPAYNYIVIFVQCSQDLIQINFANFSLCYSAHARG